MHGPLPRERVPLRYCLAAGAQLESFGIILISFTAPHALQGLESSAYTLLVRAYLGHSSSTCVVTLVDIGHLLWKIHEIFVVK